MPYRRRLILAASLVLARTAPAQSTTGIAAVDSANVARAAWARAAAALERDDSTAARREIEHAAESWPTQPAYMWARAVLAGRAHDTSTTIDALRQYAALGLGRDLSGETFAWLRATPAFAAIAAVHGSNAAPVARSRMKATLSDSTFWPEGMDYDSASRRFYVASVVHRTIAEIRPDGSTRELIARDRRDLGAMLGVRVDAKRGVLWATTSAVRAAPGFATGDTTAAELLRIRIGDGGIERRWRLPASAGLHTLGDLAIGPQGDVFVTDSDEPVLYRLRPGADAPESFRNALFRSLQGIAPTPDGRAVYVADYSHGLLRVDLDTRAVVRLEDAPGSTSVGCDGIVWDARAHAIIAVQNGVAPARVMRFVLDPLGARIVRAELLDRNVAVADEPTIGVIAGREFVYVANSQWEKYDDAGRRNPRRPLTAPVLLAVPIP